VESEPWPASVQLTLAVLPVNVAEKTTGAPPATTTGLVGLTASVMRGLMVMNALAEAPAALAVSVAVSLAATLAGGV
jgi:hypothetical protein